MLHFPYESTPHQCISYHELQYYQSDRHFHYHDKDFAQFIFVCIHLFRCLENFESVIQDKKDIHYHNRESDDFHIAHCQFNFTNNHINGHIQLIKLYFGHMQFGKKYQSQNAKKQTHSQQNPKLKNLNKELPIQITLLNISPFKYKVHYPKYNNQEQFDYENALWNFKGIFLSILF